MYSVDSTHIYFVECSSIKDSLCVVQTEEIWDVYRTELISKVISLHRENIHFAAKPTHTLFAGLLNSAGCASEDSYKTVSESWYQPRILLEDIWTVSGTDRIQNICQENTDKDSCEVDI